jgi:hypothetical protein
VTFDQVDLGRLYIHVEYVIRATNDPRNLVFPFYVIPAEPTAVAAIEPGPTTMDGR